MGSDRARVTYDRSRQWRGVVAQQGRVSIEADINEQAAIDAARDQLTTLDTVGPCGTPDNGYQVSAVPAVGAPAGATPADVVVGAGTLYLGGERLELPAAVAYSDQPDWREHSTDPRYVAPLSGATSAATGTGSPAALSVTPLTQPLAAGTPFGIAGDTNTPPIAFTVTAAGAVGDTSLAVSASPAITTSIPPGALIPSGTELIYLVATEQEVSATEDPALADVALGGPDTAQRLRILQRVLRTPTLQRTATDAWAAQQSGPWSAAGYELDPSRMRLDSTARLQVSFPNLPGAPTPCQPVTTGGYLGAENQLIRVAITSVQDGVPTIAWAYDDASFLYRCSSVSYDSGTETTTVTLAGAPVDSAHYPVAGQVVELLRDAVALTATDFIAAPTGLMSALPSGTSYDPTQRTLTVGGQPPAEYLSDTAQLYLRVWQDELTAPAGTPVALGTSGVSVTLSSTDGAFHPGDFWHFAVRPIDPTVVYPTRYLEAAQPPDGPRTWSCPLALVTWAEGTPEVTPCVPQFDDLVTLTENVGGCCTVSIRPSDVDEGATLAAFVAGYAGQDHVTICLEPGTYTLPGPLILGAAHDGLTLRACRRGVVLCGPGAPDARLLLGLVVIEDAVEVTLDGIDIRPPLVPFTPAAGAFSGLSSTNATLLDAFASGVCVGIGVSIQGATDLTICDCAFIYPDLGQTSVFGAGVYASGVIDGLSLRDCRFEVIDAPVSVPFADLANPGLEGQSPQPPYQMTFGYLQLPTGESTPTPTPTPLPVSLIERLARVGALSPTLTFHPTFVPPTVAPTLPVHPPLTVPPFTLPPITPTPFPTFTVEPPPTILPLPTPTPTPVPTPTPILTDPGTIPVPVLHDATVSGCRFEGLTVPVLGLAQLGTVSLHHNTVRNCYAGVWLVSFDDAGAVTLFDQLGGGVSGVWSDFAGSALTALLDRVFMMAFAMGQVLPTSPPLGVSLPLRIIQIPGINQINSVQSLLGRLVGILSPATPGASPAPAGAQLRPTLSVDTDPSIISEFPRPTFRLPEGFVPVTPVIPPVFPGIARLSQELTSLQATGAPATTAPPAETGVETELRLDIADSEIDAVVADSWSGAGIVVLDVTARPGAMTLHGNRIRNRFPQGQAAVAVQVAEAAITGNVVANEVTGAIATGQPSGGTTPITSSLVVRPTVDGKAASVAVTGNVLLGQDSPLTLPARPLAAPLDTWDVLNSVSVFTPPPTPTPTASPPVTAPPPPTATA